MAAVASLAIYAFDLVWLNGRDLRGKAASGAQADAPPVDSACASLTMKTDRPYLEGERTQQLERGNLPVRGHRIVGAGAPVLSLWWRLFMVWDWLLMAGQALQSSGLSAQQCGGVSATLPDHSRTPARKSAGLPV